MLQSPYPLAYPLHVANAIASIYTCVLYLFFCKYTSKMLVGNGFSMYHRVEFLPSLPGKCVQCYSTSLNSLSFMKILTGTGITECSATLFT